MKSFRTLFGCEAGASGRVVALGVPYDRGTDPEHGGAAAAPTLIRSLSGPEHHCVAKGQLFDLESRSQLFVGADLSDLGNLRFQTSGTDDAYLAQVGDAIATLVHAGKRTLVLGGDHLVTLAVLRGYAQVGRRVQVVQLDAHHDLDEHPVAGERPTHATFMSTVADEGLAAQVLQIGVRGLSPYLPRTPAGVHVVGLAALERALLPATDVYLTVDTDAFDPATAPAVSYPEAGGLGFDALDRVIATIRAAGLAIVGADWTEYNPRFDTAHHLTGRLVVRGVAALVTAMAQTMTAAVARHPEALR
jgi:arginase